mmetsp:Transcript_1513/g.5191  ORF Transcript_1513/g.5191 Transcript_1513/m.5191 type:complete len:290 (+) Transcript_1513:401-1270(+)
MTSCMALSVSKSTLAVASSKHTTLVSRNSALTRQSICRCPAEKFSPYSATGASSPRPCSPTAFFMRAASRANQSVSSLCSLNGSRLSRMFPLNKMGSWGMHVIRDRKSFSEILDVSTSSSQIVPECISTSRQSATINVDLPLPVLPTMPTFSPALTEKETPRNTRGKPGRYRICTFSNLRKPADGQFWCTGFTTPLLLNTAPVASSGSNAVYSTTRSTLTMLLSSSDTMRISHDSKPVMSMAKDRVNPTSAAYVLPLCHTPKHATTNVMEFPIVSRRTGSHRSHPHFWV